MANSSIVPEPTSSDPQHSTRREFIGLALTALVGSSTIGTAFANSNEHAETVTRHEKANLRVLQESFNLVKKTNEFRFERGREYGLPEVLSALNSYTEKVKGFIDDLHYQKPPVGKLLIRYELINQQLETDLSFISKTRVSDPQLLLLRPLVEYVSAKGLYSFPNIYIKEYEGVPFLFVAPACYSIKEVNRKEVEKNKFGESQPSVNTIYLHKKSGTTLGSLDLSEPTAQTAYGSCVIYPQKIDQEITDWQKIIGGVFQVTADRDYQRDFKTYLKLNNEKEWKVAAVHVAAQLFDRITSETPFPYAVIENATLVHETSHITDISGGTYLSSMYNLKSQEFHRYVEESYNLNVHSEIKAYLSQIIDSQNAWIGVFDVLVSFIERTSDSPSAVARRWIGKEFSLLAKDLGIKFLDVSLKDYPTSEAKGLLTLLHFHERPYDMLQLFKDVRRKHELICLTKKFDRSGDEG